MDADRRIVDTEAVPDDGTVLFTIVDGSERSEGILLRLSDGIVAFENYCPHWRDVRLDKGSGATLRGAELVCEKHGATFETDTGYCNFGPCEGATLSEVDVTVADGGVYLTEDGCEFGGLGPADDGDLSSGSRIGFSGN
ncbi:MULTISPECIES: Rieske (2Fe-2S) protein [unclassified Halomicrobium]|uniref:Rieske (2Fe-2S) protein n=1 Tax=unclassified Halomicrobium TaxID=2610901 RepID=UPI0012983639|nr:MULTISPECIES: Rieske (2Fe-2S) protein [unclassified Halomicrobium]MBO4246879.1 Rieske (2Fe-2S) protein [Halomicrobium sp. IBSBa]QGA83363.1 Rieske (2Fe-2S) domain protein [Halomicrobium sp. LC1Hm]